MGRVQTGHATIIIPTRNESANIEPLVTRLRASLVDQSAEILFVDDSDDDTPEQIRLWDDGEPVAVRLLHRSEDERTGGLGGAVLHGLQHCEGDWAVVMDGDLQHPPEVVLSLLERGVRTQADVVVASRYVGNGKADGLSSAARARVSGVATNLSRAVFPVRLRGCTDPMSGFFALRTGAVDLERLRPRGFKVLLEILARSPRLSVAEEPFTFAERLAGDSKASLAEGLLFLRRLAALRVTASWLPGAALVNMARFGAVGVTGIAVNSLALWFLVALVGLPVLLGAAAATQVSTTWNFLLADRLVFRGAKEHSSLRRFCTFSAVNNLALVARLPLLALLVSAAGVGYLLANLITLVVLFLARYLIADRYVFRTGAHMPDGTAPTMPGASSTEPLAAPADRSPVELVIDLRERADDKPREVAPLNTPAAYLEHRYDIHGLVTVASCVALPELEYFKSARVRGPFDIEVRTGPVDTSRRLRRRTRVTQQASPPAVLYQEHLGRLGSDFRVELGTTIQVTVGPLLTRSPHVLYTNVLEALLRFVLVSRGYMLLHSACIEVNGRGVMLSALTDTGKTGTILRLLREQPSRFLSDDMTILAKDGTARCFPKPLTISQHTLRAVDAGELTRKEWRRLRLQSRLHSKEGRGIGTWLGQLNVPIMSMNALTQYLVPPPKYVVDRLVPCHHAEVMRIEELFIIERRDHDVEGIDDRDTLLDELIANTDDAYGFPPFRYFAPALVMDGMSYEELRVEERKILSAALDDVRARRVATPDYTWADRIPQLLAADERLVHEHLVPLQRPEPTVELKTG